MKLSTTNLDTLGTDDQIGSDQKKAVRRGLFWVFTQEMMMQNALLLAIYVVNITVARKSWSRQLVYSTKSK